MSKKNRLVVVGLAVVTVVAVLAAILYKTISTNGINGITSFFGNNEAAEVVITPELSAALQKYEQVGDFHEGLAAVMVRNENGNELIGYMNEVGVEVIPCSYAQASSFSEGLAAVQGESGWQFINNKGEVVISDKCEGIGDFHNGLAPIRKNGKWGYIDKKGKEVIASVYDNAYVFHDGYAVVVKNEKYGYIDKTGKELISCQYDLADWFSEGLAAVVKDGKLGYVNTDGDIAIPLEYDSNVTFWPHPWYDKFKNKTMLVDEEEVFPRPDLCEHCFADGVVSVAKNGKYGAINKRGETIIPFEHEYIGHFADGLAAVKNNGKYGYINTSGKVVISCKYDAAGDFHDGMAYVAISQDGTEWGNFLKGYINTKGEAVIPCNLDARWAYDFHNGIAVIVLNGVPYDSEFGVEGLNDIIGLVDKSGKMTFTDDVFAKIAAAKSHQVEEQRRQEEQARQEEERLRREGQELVISMSADVVDGYNFTNKQCNIGECSRRYDQLISSTLTVPEGKVVLFKYLELDSRGTNLDYVRLFVIGTDGRERTYEAETCGEFPIFAGERYRALIHLYTGRDGNHVNAVYHFKEIDRDLY